MRKEFFNTKNLKLDLYMINCGYEDCMTNFVSTPHIRKYFLIHYVTKGSGYYEVEGQKYFASRGDAFLIYPNQIVTYYSPDADNTWSFCWIGFSGSKSREYLDLTGVQGYVKNGVSPEFYSNIMSCLEYVEENKANISQLKLNACILNCLFAMSKDDGKKPAKAVSHVAKAIRYIEYNYMNEISPKDVSSYLNLDRTYFFRIFKNYTGMSPEQYLMNYRIRKSLELLKHSKYSIAEIATFVGIQDAYYFSRLFKKVMNESPTEYRKNASTLPE